MKVNNGNVWRKDNYDGYGVFGGKDFFVLLAEMNGKQGNHESLRQMGGELYYKRDNIL